MSADLLVKIQGCRLGKRVEQLRHPLLLLNKLLDDLGIVNRMIVKNEENGLPHARHESLEKDAEDLSSGLTFAHHEAEFAAETHCRDRVQ